LIIEVFEVPMEVLNLKFIKYLISIVLKLCTIKPVISLAGYDQVFGLSE
jgi:hypothetical protein